MKIHGDEYKVSAGVILNVVQDLPTVGIIQDIYIVNGDKVALTVDEFSTSLSSLHIRKQYSFHNCGALEFVYSYYHFYTQMSCTGLTVICFCFTLCSLYI